MNQNTNNEQLSYLKLQCPECGAPIKVTQDSHAICPFCNQTFLIDESEGLIVNINMDYGNSKETKKTIYITLIALSFFLLTAFLILLAIFFVNYDAIHSNFFSSDYEWGVTGANVGKKLCEDIFDKRYQEISDDEFATIRYIQYDNEQLSGTDESIHIVQYSFTDYQDCENEEEFQSTIKTWTCQEYISNDPCDQSPDFSMLTGLTRIAMDEHMYQYSKSKFSKSANIRYVSCYSQSIDTRDIQEVINPEKVEVLEYMLTQDIEGIKEFSNLKTLQIDVWFGSEFDISEIEQCQNLEKLVITERSTDFIGLEKIEKLKNLKSLSLPSLYLHECDFIKNLTNLEQLTIEIDNENSKTEMLRNLKKLNTLHLSGNSCVPSKVIKQLPNVTTLKLSINSSEALRALKKLTNLTTLDVCIEVPSRTGQATLNISSLAKFPNLEYLHIQPKPDFSSDKLYIYGLESLLNNSKLKGIYINEREPSFMSSSDNNLILCIDKDSFHTNDTLRQLQFVSCAFQDKNTDNVISLDFVTHYPNLEYLVADDCDIEDISFITSLPNLKYCSLTHNNLQDFTPLNQCRFLEVVAIYGNPNDTPELSEEIIILTGEPDSVTLTE